MQRDINPQTDLSVQLTITLADLPELTEEAVEKIKAILTNINHDIETELVGMPSGKPVMFSTVHKANVQDCLMKADALSELFKRDYDEVIS